MAAWPGGLPQQFLRQGYKETPPEERLRTKMSAGPDKLRVRTSAVPRKVSGAMYMTDADLTTLETFYDTTTNGGVDKFDFPYRTGTQEARFLSVPAYSKVGQGWNVSINLEVFV